MVFPSGSLNQAERPMPAEVTMWLTVLNVSVSYSSKSTPFASSAATSFSMSVDQTLDAELRHNHGLAVTEFDVLITLFNAPDQKLGMSELADRVTLSPAGTTHLVTRLERDGLVRREVDPRDRRKWFTVLTQKG